MWRTLLLWVHPEGGSGCLATQGPQMPGRQHRPASTKSGTPDVSQSWGARASSWCSPSRMHTQSSPVSADSKSAPRQLPSTAGGLTGRSRRGPHGPPQQPGARGAAAASLGPSELTWPAFSTWGGWRRREHPVCTSYFSRLSFEEQSKI